MKKQFSKVICTALVLILSVSSCFITDIFGTNMEVNAATIYQYKIYIDNIDSGNTNSSEVSLIIKSTTGSGDIKEIVVASYGENSDEGFPKNDIMLTGTLDRYPEYYPYGVKTYVDAEFSGTVEYTTYLYIYDNSVDVWKQLASGTHTADGGWLGSKEYTYIDYAPSSFCPNEDYGIFLDTVYYPKGYDKDSDHYNFMNYNQNIVKASYIRAFGKYKGEELYKKYEKDAHGVCYGMASSTTALLKNRIALDSFSSPQSGSTTGKTLIRITPWWISSLFGGHTLTEYIGYAHILQFDEDVITASDKTKNDMEGLFNAVKKYVNGTGEHPIIILSKYNIFKQRTDRHAVAVSGYKETANEYIILVDDSNNPGILSEIVVNKDFSYWEFDAANTFYSFDNGEFVYSFPANTVYNMGIMWESSVSPFLSSKNLLVAIIGNATSENDFTKIDSTIDGDSETDNSKTLYWVSDDVNTVEMTANEDETEILIADENSAISIQMNCNDRAKIHVDDNDNKNSVDITSTKGKNVDISFLSTDSDGEEIKTIIQGFAADVNVVAHKNENGIEVSGIESATVVFSYKDSIVTKTVSNKNGDTFDIIIDNVNIEIDCRDKHKDIDANGKCDNCENKIIIDNNLSTSLCSHLCHCTDWFLQFVWEIYNFLMKIFSMERYCSCGAAHY